LAHQAGASYAFVVNDAHGALWMAPRLRGVLPEVEHTVYVLFAACRAAIALLRRPALLAAHSCTFVADDAAVFEYGSGDASPSRVHKTRMRDLHAAAHHWHALCARLRAVMSVEFRTVPPIPWPVLPALTCDAWGEETRLSGARVPPCMLTAAEMAPTKRLRSKRPRLGVAPNTGTVK